MLGTSIATEVTLRIVLQSPNLVIVKDVRSFRQNGEPLTITQARLDHQKRQIMRREARKLRNRLRAA